MESQRSEEEYSEREGYWITIPLKQSCCITLYGCGREKRAKPLSTQKFYLIGWLHQPTSEKAPVGSRVKTKREWDPVYSSKLIPPQIGGMDHFGSSRFPWYLPSRLPTSRYYKYLEPAYAVWTWPGQADQVLYLPLSSGRRPYFISGNQLRVCRCTTKVHGTARHQVQLVLCMNWAPGHSSWFSSLNLCYRDQE